MSFKWEDWSARPATPPEAPYGRFSPNLSLIAAMIRLMFGAKGGSGFNVRRSRGGTRWSPHAWGAGWDGSFLGNAGRRADAIAWLLANWEALGVQAVHDYAGARIWHAGRTRSSNPADWWKPQPTSASTGFGYSSHLHIETHPSRWADTRPIVDRLRGEIRIGAGPLPLVVVLGGLKRGATGLDVLFVQRVVNAARGSTMPEDGIFGPITAAGVRDFQRANNAKPDGIVGPVTWALIIEAAKAHGIERA